MIMNINISRTSGEMAQRAAACAAQAINRTIAQNGEARILLSTGESQIEAIRYLTEMEVEWDKVVMFHLDEYINLAETHKASFRKYLKERFIQVVNPKKAYLVNGEGNVEEHIAFNDPPADFETDKAYIIVNLDQTCKQQQVNEGWFGSLDEVPVQAISMTVPQILKSRTIVTIVPGIRKSDAIQKTLSAETVTNLVPATILKTHPDWNLFLDGDSASKAIPQV